MVLALATSIVIARLYGIEIVGAYALVLAPTGLLAGFASLREQVALTRDVATLEPREPRVTALTVAVLSFSTVLTVVVSAILATVTAVVMSGPVGRPDLIAPALALIVNYVVLVNLSFNSEAVLIGFRAGRQLYSVRQLQAVSYLVFAIAAAFVSESVWSLVVATIVSSLVGLLGRLRFLRPFVSIRVTRHELRDGFRALPGLVRYGARTAPGGTADAINHEVGTIILGITSPVAVTGAWSRAWMLSRRLAEPTYRVSEMLFPTLVERRANRDAAGFDDAAVDSARYGSIGMLLLASAGGGAAYGVMDLFGPGFSRAADALALLLLVPFLFYLTVVLAAVLAAVERPLLASILSVGRVGVIVAIAIPLGVAFGVTGVAAAYVIGYGIDVCVRSIVTARHLTTRLRRLWPLREMAAMVAAYVLAFAASRLVDDAVGTLFGTLLALATGVLVFLAVFLVLGGINDRDRKLLTRLLKRRDSRVAMAGTATSPP